MGAQQAMWQGSQEALDVSSEALLPVGVIVAYIEMMGDIRKCSCEK